ncbi:histidine phosphatase family protein [Deinococcus yavapaiensis]|uniref:Broad specificity phosphatase PhoE n=1 Tax=Deinococcus yavapaiensis KR-236 TaxID=694435 RepID=A0A318SCI0_9DEIO|nr:histidine phosphatase family protein [Deinococcus yavapaiensis]PYE54128.1 broad specificity phosphatase PhoE [Deinococcus yavapaiensis KR-236]
MSTLTLVRHGQATPFEDDTDRLSPLGERQARVLGEFWRARGVSFTEVWCGTLVRQTRTYEIARDALGEALPNARFDERLSEYAADGILGHLAPRLAKESEAFGALMEASRTAMRGPERNRYFQRMLEALMAHWQTADDVPEGVESWSTFADRTRRVFGDILRAPGAARHVIVFTSGGVIGRAVQLALRAPDDAMLTLNWRVRNASLTTFTFSGPRLSLDEFNVTAHLPADLVTYR